MKPLFFRICFHRSGKPRGWLRFVLFKDGWVARPLFRRIVHKKNGQVRLRFNYWVESSRTDQTESGQTWTDQTASGQTSTVIEALRPAELTLKALMPLEVTVESWRGRRKPSTLLDKQGLIDCIAPSAKATQTTKQQTNLLIAVGHDNYLKVQGGVQLCLQREELLAPDHGFAYLQIHPWHPLPRISFQDEDPDYIVVAVLNGTEIGACRISQLIAAVEDLTTSQAREVTVVVHHLLGHQTEQIAELVLATKSERCIFWLHDFFSICPSYTLKRNTIAYCNAPDVESNACLQCLFGKMRRGHQARMVAFFKRVSVDVVSPSAVTAALWQEKSGLRSRSVTVVPHAVLDFQESPETTQMDAPATAHKPITICYLGALEPHKGWPIFIKLMHQHAGSSDYRFVVMSTERPQLGEDKWVAVNVTAQTPTAMSDAVNEEDVDIVLHWPNSPETFSFTTFEALAGAAYVLTNSGSGNVAATVEKTGRGEVLGDEADLLAFFTDGRAHSMAANRRDARQTKEISVQPSLMSYSLLEKMQK